MTTSTQLADSHNAAMSIIRERGQVRPIELGEELVAKGFKTKVAPGDFGSHILNQLREADLVVRVSRGIWSPKDTEQMVGIPAIEGITVEQVWRLKQMSKSLAIELNRAHENADGEIQEMLAGMYRRAVKDYVMLEVIEEAAG